MNNKITKFVVIYVRVSTEEQKDKGFSLESQEEKIIKFAKENDMTVLMVFKEDHSAKKGFDRPEYKKMKAFIKNLKGKVNAILVTQYSRFSRDSTMCLQELAVLREANVKMMAIEQPLDETIPENLVMLMIYVAQPEIENRRLSLRTKEGLRKGKKMGYWMTTAPKGFLMGRDLYGKSILIKNTNDADLIHKAFTMAACGEMNMDAIRKFLNSMGMKISKNTMPNILRNVVYMGYIKIPEHDNDPEHLVKAKFDGIVSEELFHQVQLNFQKRKIATSKFELQENFPYQGMLRCDSCDSLLYISTSKGNGGYYPYHECRNKKCHVRTRISAKIANELVAQEVFKITIPEEVGELYLEILNDKFGNELGDINKKIQEIVLLRKFEEDALMEIDKKRLTGQLIISDERMNNVVNSIETKIIEFKCKEIELKQAKDGALSKAEYGLNLLVQLRTKFIQAPINMKRKIVGLIFGSEIKISKNSFRTNKLNEFVSAITNNISDLAGKKRRSDDSNPTFPNLAPRAGLEPATP